MIKLLLFIIIMIKLLLFLIIMIKLLLVLYNCRYHYAAKIIIPGSQVVAWSPRTVAVPAHQLVHRAGL